MPPSGVSGTHSTRPAGSTAGHTGRPAATGHPGTPEAELTKDHVTNPTVFSRCSGFLNEVRDSLIGCPETDGTTIEDEAHKAASSRDQAKSTAAINNGPADASKSVGAVPDLVAKAENRSWPEWFGFSSGAKTGEPAKDITMAHRLGLLIRAGVRTAVPELDKAIQQSAQLTDPKKIEAIYHKNLAEFKVTALNGYEVVKASAKRGAIQAGEAIEKKFDAKSKEISKAFEKKIDEKVTSFSTAAKKTVRNGALLLLGSVTVIGAVLIALDKLIDYQMSKTQNVRTALAGNSQQNQTGMKNVNGPSQSGQILPAQQNLG